jgi:pantetheine-phosphate adenylyltransferase
MKKYRKVAVGGTFDELHKGHKALLEKAFAVGENVVIGLTSDEFVLKMGKPHKSSPYTERLQELQAYLEKAGFSQRAKIVMLTDSLGLTTTDKCLDALIVSKETKTSTTDIINEKRKNAGLQPLKIVAINMVPAENHTPISTTRICSGEIDREGNMLKSAK